MPSLSAVSFISALVPRLVCGIRDHCLGRRGLAVPHLWSLLHGSLQLTKIPYWLLTQRPAHLLDGSRSILRGETLPSASVSGAKILSLCFSHSLDFVFHLKTVVWV